MSPNGHSPDTFRMRDGTEITVRLIRPDDEPLIMELHEGHSEQTIRRRFFSMVKTLSRKNLTRLCQLDGDREVALVAERRDGQGRPHILGVSRYYLNPKTGNAEFAVVVSDRWQRQGLGRHLMERLIGGARKRGVKQLVGLVLRENVPMQRLVNKLGFVVRSTDDYSVVEAVLDVSPNVGNSGFPSA